MKLTKQSNEYHTKTNNKVSKTKLFILFFILFISSFVAKGQEYYPIPDSNLVWIIRCDNGFGGALYDTYKTSVNKNDTLINSKFYTKLFESFNLDSLHWYYKGCYRSDTNGLTYFVPDDSINEYLIRDFSKTIGDTIKNVYFGYPDNQFITDFYVDSFNYVAVGPYMLKRMYLSYDSLPYPYYQLNLPLIWIEKIGSPIGGFFNDVPAGLGGCWLDCMSYNDTTYFFLPDVGDYGDGAEYYYGKCHIPFDAKVYDFYQNSYDINITPNPFNDFITIKNIDTNYYNSYDLKVYNSLGQLAYQKETLPCNSVSIDIKLPNLNKGIYFIIINNKNKYIYTKNMIKE